MCVRIFREFMNNVGPLKDKRKMSLRSAKSVAQELISSASGKQSINYNIILIKFTK